MSSTRSRLPIGPHATASLAGALAVWIQAEAPE
jgi:hypothetical protein